MALLNNNTLAGASGQAGGYFLEDSLRFRSSASAYLNRTPSSAGNRRTWTFSCWVKRSKFGDGITNYQSLISAQASGTSGTPWTCIQIDQFNRLRIFYEQLGVTSEFQVITNPHLKDPSAWYHIVVQLDTTQSTDSDRVKMYINGEHQTSLFFTNYPTLNEEASFNNNIEHLISYYKFTSSNVYSDHYLTEMHFVDGTALTASDFGEYDDDTGVWKPKRYNGSYGTNGFYLKGRGTDNSGNGNNFTENNIDTSSGDATYDLMSDVPTLTDEDTNNFATLNSNNMAVNTTMTDGNLKASNSVNHATMFPTNMPTTGKYYFECKMAVNAVLGLGFRTDTNKVESAYSDEANKYYFYLNNSNAYRIVETTNTALGANLNNTTSTFQVAIDFDAAKYYFGRDNTWYAADWGTDGDPASGTNPSYDLTDGTKMFPFVYVAGGTWTVNFGQQPFNYTPPTGFKKINAYNLPDSTIVDGSNYFDTTLYTGNGSTQSITGLEFQPDFLWLKARTGGSYSHHLVDAVRGNNKFIMSNRTDAEQTSTDQVTAFTSDGFTLGADSAGPNDREVNESSRPIVAWSWDAGGAGSSNTDGSITSTVSANTTAGFSIVRYSGNATSGATVGHGLGVAPEIVIGKTLNTGGYNWPVYVTALGDTSKTLTLDLTAAAGTETNKYNGTAPSATVVTLGNHGTNLSGTNNQVLYCFAPVEGYSKFGSYYGNGSADGPFVYTGFRPAWIMTKKTNNTSQWAITDTARSTYNVAKETLEANTSSAESSGTAYQIDILSNGFKLRDTDDARNGSGDTYIYMAFAENPFKNSNAR